MLYPLSYEGIFTFEALPVFQSIRRLGCERFTPATRQVYFPACAWCKQYTVMRTACQFRRGALTPLLPYPPFFARAGKRQAFAFRGFSQCAKKRYASHFHGARQARTMV